jgi:hypothetical protein
MGPSMSSLKYCLRRVYLYTHSLTEQEYIHENSRSLFYINLSPRNELSKKKRLCLTFHCIIIFITNVIIESRREKNKNVLLSIQ